MDKALKSDRMDKALKSDRMDRRTERAYYRAGHVAQLRVLEGHSLLPIVGHLVEADAEDHLFGNKKGIFLGKKGIVVVVNYPPKLIAAGCCHRFIQLVAGSKTRLGLQFAEPLAQRGM